MFFSTLQVHHLRKALITAFKESSGSDALMSRSEFSAFLQSLNIHVYSNEVLRALFRSFDIDNSGDVSWGELVIITFPFKGVDEYSAWESCNIVLNSEMDHLDEHKRLWIMRRIRSMLGYHDAVSSPADAAFAAAERSLGARQLATLRAFASENVGERMSPSRARLSGGVSPRLSGSLGKASLSRGLGQRQSSSLSLTMRDRERMGRVRSLKEPLSNAAFV